MFCEEHHYVPSAFSCECGKAVERSQPSIVMRAISVTR
jgi:hypothetical protein